MDIFCPSRSGERSGVSEAPSGIVADLQDLLALGLTADPGRTPLAKDHEDSEVEIHQQLYCRYTSQHYNMPIHSWRSDAFKADSSSPPAHADHRSAAPQQTAKGLCSPFLALSQHQYATGSSTELATCLPPVHDLCSSFEGISQLTEPTPSSLSCNTPNPYSTMPASLIDRYPSVHPSPTQELLAAYSSLPSVASDSLVLPPIYPSPSKPSPAPHAEPAQVVNMVKPRMVTPPMVTPSMVLSPMEVTFSLSAAPAAFARPIRINKSLNPPFQASVTIYSQSPGSWHVRVTACLLTADQVKNLHTWHPKTQDDMPDVIDKATAECTVSCKPVAEEGGASGDGQQMYRGKCRLVFKDMRFASSSRMRPRWLVFFMLLPNGDCMFVHYKLPTIIMSRSCDQIEKAAALLTGQEIITKKKRPRSPAGPERRMRQGGVQPAPQAHAPALLHHAPPTPGRSTPPEFLTPGRQLSLPTQISGFSPQTLPPGVLYHSPTPSHDQQMTALRPSQLKQLVGHSEPPLSQADQACLMHLGTQSMSQECRVGSGQVPAQLPTQLPVPVARPRDPRTLSPPVTSQASPACSGQFPAQPPANSPAKSRDPRRPANQCSAVATSVSHPVEGLRHSPQISEPMTPTSPTQSALFASIMMLDSPDAMSGVLNTGDALMNSEDALMTGPSPARWHSPEPQAPFQQTQFSDTSLPALEQLLGNHRDFEFAAECEELSACMVDPESFLLNEAIQAAGQHSQQAQRDSVSPPEAQRDSVSPPLVPLSSETSPGISQAQSLARRAPSSSLESQNFPSPKGQTIFLLQQLPGCDSNESFSAARKGGRNSLRRKWPEVQPYTFCRWQLLVMEFYEDCEFLRDLTFQDMRVLGQMAGFKNHHPQPSDKDLLSAQQWLSFGQWFLSQLRMLHRQRRHWEQRDPFLISSFEVNHPRCEDILRRQSPGTFLVRHGISQKATLVVSLVSEDGSIRHSCLDSQQLDARPLQAWVMSEPAARFLVDHSTRRVWKKEQVFSQLLQPDNGPTAASALLEAASHTASVGAHADSDSPQRRPQQACFSAGRIVTSLSSVTKRHLRQRSLSSVTGSYSP